MTTPTHDTTSLIAEAITDYYGVRCPDHEPDCACCKAWAAYDVFAGRIQEINRTLTQPENAPILSANVNMPTREEVADYINVCRNRVWTPFETADFILALFAPALAAAEKRGMEKAADIYATASDWGYFSAAEAAIRAEMEKM